VLIITIDQCDPHGLVELIRHARGPRGTPQPGETAAYDKYVFHVGYSSKPRCRLRHLESGQHLVGRNGTERRRTPVASNTAFEIAAGMTLRAISPGRWPSMPYYVSTILLAKTGITINYY
jgi:hypothetical protein